MSQLLHGEDDVTGDGIVASCSAVGTGPSLVLLYSLGGRLIRVCAE